MLIFCWDEWNESHINEHGVTKQDAARVASNPRPPYPIVSPAGKILVRGPSSASRHLQVIYVLRPVESIRSDSVNPEDRLHLLDVAEVAYVIHARELLERERRSNRRK